MDKNGKLFGKINIIDLLVIIVALIIIVAVALKMTGRMGPAVEVVGTDIEYTARVNGVDPEVYENVCAFIEAAKEQGKPGDRLMANGELLNGYITAVEAIPHVAYGYDAEGNAVLSDEEDGRLDVFFTIQAHVAENVKTEVGTQEVRVGKSHIVKTTHFELVNGLIVDCQWAGGTKADS